MAVVELSGQLGHACAMPRDVMAAPAPEGKERKDGPAKPESNLAFFGNKVLNPEDWSCPSISVYIPTITG